jgi:hypothetical protein
MAGLVFALKKGIGRRSRRTGRYLRVNNDPWKLLE